MSKPRDILITTCGRDAVRWIRHTHKHVIISITDPPPFGDGKRVNFDIDDDKLDVLHLSFADFHAKHANSKIIDDEFGPENRGRFLIELAMTPSHASCIREFLEMWWGKFATLIVHCEAGVSRSPSIALAIAERLGISRYAIEPVSRNWDAQPINPWCYGLVSEALKGARLP